MSDIQTEPTEVERLRSEIIGLKGQIGRLNDLMRDMQADQRASDQGALMFIAALVRRFGADHEDGKLVMLTEPELVLGSEGELLKANTPEGGVRLWHGIEREAERALREGYNKAKAALPPVSPFRASLELPPEHVVTGEAAVARGVRMMKNATAPGEKT